MRSLKINRIPLETFGLEVTQECNSNCQYCYNVWKCTPNFPRFEADTQVFNDIILKLKDETKVKLISVTGGEPLIRSDIPEIIGIMKENKIKCNLLTNGALLTEKMAINLIDLSVSIFEIPLLAPEPGVHDELMRAEIFRNAVRGIADLTSNGGKVVTAFVATKKNIESVGETMDLAFSLGVKGVMFNRFNPGGEGIKFMDELMPTLEQLKRALETIDRKAQELGLFVSSQIPMPPCIINMKQYKNIKTGFCPSGGKGSYFTIDGAGNVRTCNHSPVILGNMLENQFQELIKSSALAEFQTKVPVKCSECDQLPKCHAGCKASGLVCYGDFDKLDPFVNMNQ